MVNKLNIEYCLEQIKDETYQKWSFRYLDIIKKRGFDDAPASRNLHHSNKGGLRNHTEEMLFIGNAILNTCNFKDINMDELIISIAFHDAGKADLYMVFDGAYTHNPNSLIYIKPHNFIRPIDHSDIPILDWEELDFNFSWNIKLAILGHMGGWSITGYYPDTLLASIVSSADLISSKINVTGRNQNV